MLDPPTVPRPRRWRWPWPGGSGSESQWLPSGSLLIIEKPSYSSSSPRAPATAAAAPWGEERLRGTWECLWMEKCAVAPLRCRWLRKSQSDLETKLIEDATELRLYTEIASDAWLSRQGGEKGRLEYPMGIGLDTDWAEASDSREEELSRLRRLGSSVESENIGIMRKHEASKHYRKYQFSQVAEILRMQIPYIRLQNLPNSASRDWRAKCNVRRLANLPVFNTTSSWPTSHKSNPVHERQEMSIVNMTAYKLDLLSPGGQEDAWVDVGKGTFLCHLLTHQEQPETHGILAVSTAAHLWTPEWEGERNPAPSPLSAAGPAPGGAAKNRGEEKTFFTCFYLRCLQWLKSV